MTMTLSALQQSVETIWSTMLGIEIEPIDDCQYPSGSMIMMGCVQITGNWQGAVMVECPAELALRIASIMFDMPESDLEHALVQDAVGELANMVGGSYKSLQPEPCNLSLPAITEGTDYAFRILDSQVVSRLCYRCESRSFAVVVFERVR